LGVAAFATLLCPAAALADTTQAYVTGAQYRAMSEAERMAYVISASDMMARMCQLVDSGSVDFCNRVARCTSDMSRGALLDFVDRYMADGNSDTYGMASNYRAAMNTNCPQ
jgi:hypothetical protein